MGNGFASGRRVFYLLHDLPRIAGPSWCNGGLAIGRKTSWMGPMMALIHVQGPGSSRTTHYLYKEFGLDCVLCIVYCVLCTVYCVLCTVYCVLCIVYVYCVLCIVYCVLCIVYCVLRIAYCVLRIAYCVVNCSLCKPNDDNCWTSGSIVLAFVLHTGIDIINMVDNKCGS
jgi:hypothetical protein